MLRNILSSELYGVMEEHKFVLDMFHVPLVFFLTYYSLYFSDRFLPDKAIDLVDEAGSRVRLRHAQV
jgi:ATP-dependent Clp protease ATP-binding subunit ClpC